jgi:uncharacterized membrane protein YphA (DoxX/SURF4 family)
MRVVHVVSIVAAAILALVFVRAGVAKINRPSATASAFEAMSLPAPRALARAVPVLELALAVALVASPRFGGALALVLIAVFSAVLVRAVGTDTGCGCFGAAHTHPVSRVDLLRNAVLGGLAFVAVLASSL